MRQAAGLSKQSRARNPVSASVVLEQRRLAPLPLRRRDSAVTLAAMIRKRTPGYTFTILVVAGLAFVVLLGTLFGITALMGR